MGSESQQVSSTQQTDRGQPLDGGDQSASPVAVSLVVGLIVASITGSLSGGLNFSGGFFLGVAISLLTIYGSALIVSYMLRTRQERDRATEEARSQRELEIENRLEEQQEAMSTSDNTTTTTSTTGTQDSTTTAPPGPPYNLILALAVVVLSTVIFGVVMYIFRDTFNEAALVTTALSTLFGIFGTVTGAYFGIKSTNDTIDKTRADIAKAHANESRALAALPPDEGKKIMGMRP